MLCGSCSRLEVSPGANTSCAVPRERQPQSQKVCSHLAIPTVFESCLFNRSFGLGILQCFPLFYGTCSQGPVEMLQIELRG